MSGLRDLEAEFPALISATRGRGTFIAFDAADAKLRDGIVNRLFTKGTLCAPGTFWSYAFRVLNFYPSVKVFYNRTDFIVNKRIA